MTHLRYNDDHGTVTLSVAELIAKLQALPPDLPVMGSWEGIECGIKSVDIEKTHAEGNPFVSLDVDGTFDIACRGDGTPLPGPYDEPPTEPARQGK